MPPITCYRLKFNQETIFVDVTPATTLSDLRTTLFSVLAHTKPESLTSPPQTADAIAFWRLTSEDNAEEETWEQLENEKSGSDKWGLKEAAEIGVSFKQADGSYPAPTVVRPVDEEEEMEQ